MFLILYYPFREKKKKQVPVEKQKEQQCFNYSSFYKVTVSIFFMFIEVNLFILFTVLVRISAKNNLELTIVSIHVIQIVYSFKKVKMISTVFPTLSNNNKPYQYTTINCLYYTVDLKTFY